MDADVFAYGGGTAQKEGLALHFLKKISILLPNVPACKNKIVEQKGRTETATICAQVRGVVTHVYLKSVRV